MKNALLGLGAAVCLITVGGSVAAQDFQKSYNNGEGGRIVIRNASGKIDITGYTGQAISVAAYKEGRDREVGRD